MSHELTRALARSTPRPWTITDDGRQLDICGKSEGDTDAWQLFSTSYDGEEYAFALECHENAELIVMAVNQHEALLAVETAARDYLSAIDDEGVADDDAIRQALLELEAVRGA